MSLERNKRSAASGNGGRAYSPTLICFGLIAATLGVAIDLFVLYSFFEQPFSLSFGALVPPLFLGLPFFGLGGTLLFLGLGRLASET